MGRVVGQKWQEGFAYILKTKIDFRQKITRSVSSVRTHADTTKQRRRELEDAVTAKRKKGSGRLDFLLAMVIVIIFSDRESQNFQDLFFPEPHIFYPYYYDIYNIN